MTVQVKKDGKFLLPTCPKIEKKIDLTEVDFHRIVKKFNTLSGITIPDHKRTLVKTRVAPRLRISGVDTFSEYIDYLNTPTGASEMEHFCNVLTTNLTSFFREIHHFEHLERELIAGKSKRVRVWSAGCSTGEEAYSIAMILKRLQLDSDCPDVRLLATDLDTKVLARANEALYDASGLNKIPERFRKYLTIEKSSNNFKIKEDLKELVYFNRLNLASRWPMKGEFDVVFCRNVLIYFSPDLKERIIDRISNMLKPGGTLYLGHSETILGGHSKLESLGNTIYKKKYE